MKLSFKFLQTGGVPLTNDLMALIEESYGIFEVLGDLAGHQTILSGCVVNGSNVSPGIVAIDGKLYYFEGGLATATVFIHTQAVPKTFEDQTVKTLIEIRTVRFGNSVAPNLYDWVDFVRLKTLNEMQDFATQAQLTALMTRVALLELKTAPVINGGIVWAWNKPVADIPAGWKECTDLKGKTIVGLDGAQPEFNPIGKMGGAKSIVQTIAQMPTHHHVMPYQINIATQGKANSDAFHRVDGAYTSRQTQQEGGSQPMNIMNPYRVCAFIEPNFP